MIYIIYSNSAEDGIIIHYMDTDFTKAKANFITLAIDWTRMDGDDNGLNFIALEVNRRSIFNLLSNVYNNPEKYTQDISTQDSLTKLFETPNKVFVENFMSEDILSWLDTEKGIEGFDALDLPDTEWDAFVKEYLDNII